MTETPKDAQTLIGAIILIGFILVLVGAVLGFLGLWTDWRWAASGVVPFLAGAFLLRFAWRLS
jgi:hypothetical protein